MVLVFIHLISDYPLKVMFGQARVISFLGVIYLFRQTYYISGGLWQGRNGAELDITIGLFCLGDVMSKVCNQ